MRTEVAKTEAFTIFDADGFDPILVVFQDLGDGRGRLLLECYGWAWGSYWGAMGTTVRDFVDQCGVDYIVNRMTNNQRRVTSVEIKRLEGIVRAVKAAIRSDNLARLGMETLSTTEEESLRERSDLMHRPAEY
jgi:hypothetical protein